ncbi:MBL fold metallo-hydrolase [Iamia sp.]|uniref:MBL fold metallo-hydrolase n=1 Tax=Iamia sp. TaxID=2722710 RepID=UPI002BE8081A|nr:MBL fold metallo-hydrolase [Iamia sp.]HXH56992.1 MBL fold metallo-hydrolase [Iamia sp.]
MAARPAPRVDKVVTSGTFSIDGEDFDVDNNIWIVGNDEECIVVDAAHDHEPIVEGVAGRKVVAVVCTHGHNDHINAAPDLADAVSAPIWLHPSDAMLWDEIHPDRPVDAPLTDGQVIAVGGRRLKVIHTPGHSPGGITLHDADAAMVFGGDTLFNGGPGATGRSFSSFATIIESIRDRILPLSDETVVHTGHGDDTTIGDEAPHLDEWVARGH